MTNMQQQADPQVQSQTPPKDAVTPKEKEVQKTYTQEQYSTMQSKLRGEIQQLKDTTIGLNEQLKTALSEGDAAKAELEVLRLEVDNPYVDEDSKTMATKIRTANIEIAKGRAANKRDRDGIDALLSKNKEGKKAETAQKLSEKWGIEIDALLKCEDEGDMYRLIAEGDVKQPESHAETQGDKPKLTRPSSIVTTPSAADSKEVHGVDRIRQALEKQ